MMMARSAFDLLRIVLFRFRPLPRAWAVLLVLVNLAAVFFLDSVYGQAAFAAMLAAVVIMVPIHYKLGFVRLLGIGHILWIPMLVWFIIEYPTVEKGSWLSVWMLCVTVCNAISLVIDTLDVGRFIRGERKPYYSWSQGPAIPAA